MAHSSHEDPDAQTQCSRRAFVGTVAGSLVCGCSGSSQRWEVKKIEDNDGVIELDIKDHPELVTPGGMMAVAAGSRKPVLVMRIENDLFRVMSLRCPHLGCTVRWDPQEQQLRCPCHGSRFADDGRVVKGPSKSSLQQYTYQKIDTRLRIKTEA